MSCARRVEVFLSSTAFRVVWASFILSSPLRQAEIISHLVRLVFASFFLHFVEIVTLRKHFFAVFFLARGERGQTSGRLFVHIFALVPADRFSLLKGGTEMCIRRSRNNKFLYDITPLFLLVVPFAFLLTTKIN